ncbi:WD40-repeat-containing domain protein [Mycena galericulata]|nr:WD40-repeat-containing domain protein [Mycena galericulata]
MSWFNKSSGDLNPDYIPNSSGQYALHTVLAGHHGSVTCLKVTEDGGFLASGGSDGVRLWDLVKMRSVNRPTGAGNRGSACVLLWVRREDEPGEILVFGTQTGLVVSWKQTTGTLGGKSFEESSIFQMSNPAEITGLAFDAASNRLAVCHRESTIQIHEMDDKMKPHTVFSVGIKNFLPKALAFGAAKGKHREIIAFGFHDGQILTLNGETGQEVHARQIGGMIGAADYNERKKVFCVDDIFQGPALYRADSETRVRTFEVKLTKPCPRPRQVCFADDCSSVVSGSDHGVVYVFDRRTGAVTDTLRVDPNDWVQTVTATHVDGISTIVAARSRDWGGRNGIVIWRKKSKTSGRRSWSHVIVLLNAAVLIGAIIYLYQKMSHTVQSSL